MLIVIDERWRRVSVYHRGVDVEMVYSFDEIKSSEKGKGPDMSELFKMFMTNMGQGI